MHYTHERNWGCRISDEFTYRDMRLLVMENEIVRVTILLDKGTDIYEFLHKPSDTDFMWRTPKGVRPPMKALDMIAPSGGPFCDYYEGGWQELLPNGGNPCMYKGAQMGQHGEVWGVPWRCQIIEDQPEIIQAKTWVRTNRTPFLLEKTFTLRTGSGTLEIDEALTNEGAEPMDLMWGHHPALGEEFLKRDCIIDCGARTVVSDPNVGEKSRFAPNQTFDWPVGTTREGTDADVSIVTQPEAKVDDMLYLTDLEEGWWAVTSQRDEVGFGISFDRETFQHIWMWASLAGAMGYPGYGRRYTLAMEPFSSFPATLTNAIEAGRQLILDAGETRQTWLRAVAYDGMSRVARIDEDGNVTRQ